MNSIPTFEDNLVIDINKPSYNSSKFSLNTSNPYITTTILGKADFPDSISNKKSPPLSE